MLSVKCDLRAFDLVMLEKSADRATISEKAARLAGFGIAADVGGDGFVEAVEHDFDPVAVVAVAFRLAKYVGREEVAELADVEMILTEVAGGDANKTLLIHSAAPSK